MFDHDMRYVAASRRWREDFRLGDVELIGRNHYEVMPEIPERWRAAHRRGLAGETLSAEEDHWVRLSGDTQWARWELRPWRDSEGQVGGIVLFVEDISERKRVAMALSAVNAELERRVLDRTAELDAKAAQLAEARRLADDANAAKSRFLANMSHEIRTPLGGILGLAHLLRRGGLDSRQSAALDKIDAAGKHLQHIIDDILDLSKIEAGMLILCDEDFVLDEFLAGVLAGFTERLQAKGLDLKVDVAALPPRLRGDRTRLGQALMNYLGNALKFTERGSINLSGEVLESLEDGLLVRFTVADTGPGLAPAQQASLFHAFVQADDSLTRNHGGTGLGLAITRWLAELMGGTAGVDSVPGEGSRFWFTARLQSAAEPADASLAASHRPAALSPDFHGLHVLLVEDDPINQEVAAFLLEEIGLAADVAENGLEALAKLETTAYPLILMDLQMPILDGLEATRRIRKSARYGHTPIIALTANAFPEDRQACMAVGMNDFLAKPLEPSELYAKLLHWLSPA